MRYLTMAMVTLWGMVSLTSCNNDFIFENEGNCETHYYVKYVFDMNMNFADAFPSQVNSVNLYVFDEETGNLIAVYSESGEALSRDGYRMEIDVEPGRYELIAWCGLKDNEGVFAMPEAITHRDHAHCRMDRKYNDAGRAYQDKWLHSLFHGKIIADFPELEGDHVVTVHLIKDTNNINLSMQHVSGQPLTSDMFTVTMTESNGHMAHDNSLIDDEEIDFYPWHLADGIVDIGSRAGDEDNLNYFKAEISTSRLMADRDPRIIITDNATGRVVYSIPIVQWALEFRSEKHAEMDNQEYLDREDEYNVMLYLDNKEDKGWLAASVFINGWRVVKHDDAGM